MTKKEYIQPAMQVIEAETEQQILTGSQDAYGMNKTLIDEEADDAWSRGSNNIWDDEE